MSKTRKTLAAVGGILAGHGLAVVVFVSGWGVVFVIAGVVCFFVAERLRIEQAHNRQGTG